MRSAFNGVFAIVVGAVMVSLLPQPLSAAEPPQIAPWQFTSTAPKDARHA